jgi:hypothetical protein
MKLIAALGVSAVLAVAGMTAERAVAAPFSPGALVPDAEVTTVQYVSPQAGVRCGAHGCWENDRYGRPTGRRMYYNNAPRRHRGYVSPQAGVRCGNYGCWENDRYGRPTGRRAYYW